LRSSGSAFGVPKADVNASDAASLHGEMCPGPDAHWFNDHPPLKPWVSDSHSPMLHEVADELKRLLTIRECTVIAIHEDQQLVAGNVAVEERAKSSTVKPTFHHQMDVVSWPQASRK